MAGLDVAYSSDDTALIITMPIDMADTDLDDEQRTTYQGKPVTGEVYEYDRDATVLAS